MKIISTRKYEGKKVKCSRLSDMHSNCFTLGKEYSIVLHGIHSNLENTGYMMIESDNGVGVMFQEDSYQEYFALVG